MAAAFAQLPARVLWRLSKSEVSDQSAIAALNLGNNTKVCTWKDPWSTPSLELVTNMYIVMSTLALRQLPLRAPDKSIANYPVRSLQETWQCMCKRRSMSILCLVHATGRHMAATK